MKQAIYSPIIIGIVACLSLATVKCGGSGSDTASTSGTSTDGDSPSTRGSLGIEATVAQPTNASVSEALGRSISRSMGYVKPKAVSEESAAGVVVHAEDTEGTTIGDPCTTDASGTCEVTGLTAEQLEAGVVLVADDGTTVLHDIEQPTAEEIAAAETSGDPIAADVNTESDMSYAVVSSTCDGDLKNCQATIDLPCMKQAIAAVMEDATPQTDDLGGFAGALFTAHAAAISNAVQGQKPADLMKQALGGQTSVLTAVTGESVSDVPVADALSNFGTMMDAIKESYCEIPTPGEKAPWRDIKESAGDNFDPRAMAGIFTGFTPTEFGEYHPEDFRGFAQALPNLEGGFQMFGLHPEARQAAIEQFRLGAFAGADSGKVGAALGFMAAAFPPPPIAGAWGDMDFSGLDPSVMARAANNGFLTYVDGTNQYANPGDIYSKFKDVLSDSDQRQAWAVGGSGAGIGDFMQGFISDPNGFIPADAQRFLKSPPGASCSTSADCLPCDSCVNSICTSLSTKMGASCEDNDDCDEITSCVGGFIAGRGGHCMCNAGVPTGAFVHSGGGQGPQNFGQAGGIALPPQGGIASQCSNSNPCAGNDLQCSDPNGGICLPNNFKKGPFAPCSSDNECQSNKCSSNICETFSTMQLSNLNGGSGSGSGGIGGRTLGQSCAAPAECASFFCQSGICAAPPSRFDGAIHDDDKKENGQSCSFPSECRSFNCMGFPNATCQEGMAGPSGQNSGPGGGFTPPTNLPVGAFCIGNAECASLSCNATTHQCR